MSIWAINYGLGSLLGIIIYLILEALYAIPIWYLLASVLLPIIFFNFFFARHAKALFLAFDLFCDPHTKEEGDEGDTDRGNHFSQPPKPIQPSGKGKTIPVYEKKRAVATLEMR
jgi:hypothetical protein